MRLSMKPSMNWFFVFMPVTVLLEHVEGTPVPLIGAVVASHGRSHWFKGIQLITLDLVIAMMFYFLPAGH